MISIVSAIANDGGYLFVTFKGEDNPMSEQIHFALSRDGRNWQALNHSEPVLVSKIGEKGVRDPYLLRSHDGSKFYLIATDLSIHLSRGDWERAVKAASKSIVIWESTDLVNWSEPRLVRVAADDAGCAWAPEAIYNEDTRDYLVFWASQTERDDFAKHRIWAARTKDFKTFGKPFIYIEKEHDVIDTTIVRDGGKYHRFNKDEKHKAITMEVADKLRGPWTEIEEFSLAKMVGYEGPQCYPVEPAADGNAPTWCLILDHYSKGEGYQPFVTGNLSGGQFKPAEGFKFPFKFRHGSVLPITGEEFARLNRRWGEHPAGAVQSASPAVKANNLAPDLSRGTLELLLNPGTDPRSFDPGLFVPTGASIEPAGPQDFSRSPVAYTVRCEGREDVTLRVSAAVRHNPVIPGYFADPDALWSVQTGRYYIYPTSDGYPGWGATSFKAFSSPDLVEWKDEGVILDLHRDVSWADRNAWAPCMIEKKTANGYRYYYYFTAAQKIGVAVGDHPAGPFTDSGRPLIDSFPPGVSHGQQIDPEVFHDPDSGKYYLYWGNGYLAGAELNEDMISIKQETLRVLTPDQTFREAASVFCRKGVYYLLWSEDDTGSENYRVRYATAKAPLGPWTIPGDNLVIAKDPASGIFGTGHNSVLQIPGRDDWCIVYHRFNYPRGIGMGRAAGHHREVCIDRLSFDAKGNIIRVKPTHDGVRPVVP